MIIQYLCVCRACSMSEILDVMGQPQTYESSGPLVQPRNFDSVTQTEGMGMYVCEIALS